MVVTLGVSQLFVLVAIGLLYAVFESVAAVAACGVLYLVVVGTIAVAAKWAANEFWLPRRWQIVLQVCPHSAKAVSGVGWVSSPDVLTCSLIVGRR